MTMAQDKHCTKCCEDWPADLEFFHADARSPDGLWYCCKACYREHLAMPRGRQQKASASGRLTDALAPLLTTPHFLGGNA